MPSGHWEGSMDRGKGQDEHLDIQKHPLCMVLANNLLQRHRLRAAAPKATALPALFPPSQHPHSPSCWSCHHQKGLPRPTLITEHQGPQGLGQPSLPPQGQQRCCLYSFSPFSPVSWYADFAGPCFLSTLPHSWAHSSTLGGIEDGHGLVQGCGCL